MRLISHQFEIPRLENAQKEENEGENIKMCTKKGRKGAWRSGLVISLKLVIDILHRGEKRDYCCYKFWGKVERT